MKKLRIKLTSSEGAVSYRYFKYDASWSCQQAETEYRKLGDPAKAALPTADPAATAGTHWETVNCAGDDGTDRITNVVLGEVETDDTAPDPTNPIPNDGSAWTGGNPGETDDEGTAVTFSDPVILD